MTYRSALAVIAALIAVPTAVRADVDDKRCILIAASKLPAIRDMRVVTVKIGAATPLMSETGRLIQERIATLSDAQSAKQFVAFYGTLTPDGERQIDLAKGDIQKLRSTTSSILESRTRPQLTSTNRVLEFLAEYADQKIRFVSTCSVAADGTANVTAPTISD